MLLFSGFHLIAAFVLTEHLPQVPFQPGPLGALIRLGSVCFHSAAVTQMNVSLYCDFISRDSVVFPLAAALLFHWSAQRPPAF